MENTYAEKEPLIKVNNLEIQYTSGKEVVCADNNVSFHICEKRNSWAGR